jgi:hypothetical protein
MKRCDPDDLHVLLPPADGMLETLIEEQLPDAARRSRGSSSAQRSGHHSAPRARGTRAWSRATMTRTYQPTRRLVSESVGKPSRGKFLRFAGC